METSPEEFARRWPELEAAFAAVRAKQLEAIAISRTSMRDEREQIYYTITALAMVRREMIEALNAQRMKDAATLANNG